ncbi:MAG: carbohydrate ABC transporter permease [Clostridiales bacterium]|nr:carbohydrate ABC transporter permease [Clostridiales bacterium]
MTVNTHAAKRPAPIREGGVSRSVFVAFNYFLLFLMMLVTLYPLYLTVIVSISNGANVMRGEVGILPVNVTLETYRNIFKGDILLYMRNSVLYTVLGTFVNIVMSCLCAYPLTRKSFCARKFYTAMVTVTLFFSGGMVPMYLAVNTFGLMDSIWALILPGAISTYNMIIIRTAFASLPDSLIESAQLDGANDLTILFRIVIPLSKATLSTMVLFYAVSHWNSYFDAMLYIRTKTKYPLQIHLRNLLVAGIASEELQAAGTGQAFAVTERTMRAATIIVSTLPILIVYPFVQRYFVSGVMIGSVKG